MFILLLKFMILLVYFHPHYIISMGIFLCFFRFFSMFFPLLLPGLPCGVKRQAWQQISDNCKQSLKFPGEKDDIVSIRKNDDTNGQARPGYPSQLWWFADLESGRMLDVRRKAVFECEE